MEEVAPLILLKLLLSLDDCHWIIPVLPLKVNVVLFVPVHTVPAPAILPDTLAGFTVTVTLDVVDEVHTPLVTIAL